MKDQSFTASILVDQTPQEAFNAIINPRKWWSEDIEGNTDELNAEWYYHYEDVHRCSVKVTELIPGKKVVWLVTDNYFNFTTDKTEWIGNKIIFEISTLNNKTQIKFTQEGLVPEYECYQVCDNAWSGYIKKSLHDLITTGTGKPNKGSNIKSHKKISA
jgi:hypothetical protein